MLELNAALGSLHGLLEEWCVCVCLFAAKLYFFIITASDLYYKELLLYFIGLIYREGYIAKNMWTPL